MPTRRSQPVISLLSTVASLGKQIRTRLARWIPRLSDSGSELTGVAEMTAVSALKSPNPHTRWDAAAALARHSHRGPEAVAALVAALADPEPFVRWQAADALAAQEQGRAFAPLCAALAGPNPLARAAAARALGRLGGEAACLELRKSLADADSSVRAAAAEAFGDCGEPTSVPALLALLTDPEETVVQAAAKALGRIGDAQAARAVAAALMRDDQSLLTDRALAAALARAPHPEVQPTLLRALQCPDPQVRGYAAQALGQVGDETVWSALSALQEDPAPLIKGTVGDSARAAIVLLERRGHRSGATLPAAPANAEKEEEG